MKRTWKGLLEATDTSLNDRMRAVQMAVSQAYNQGPGDYSYVEVVFDGYVIICKASKLWKVTYTATDDGTVTLSGEPVQVRTTYTPVNEGVLFGLLPDSDTAVKEGEQTPAPTGKKWGVLIIQEGMSKNRNRYARKVLQEAAPLYEGARIYTDHQEETRRYGRSTRDVAGFLKNVTPVLLNENAGTAKEAVAKLALAAEAVITKQSIRQEMLDAYEEGNANLYGLSHDVQAESVTVMAEAGAFYDVQRIAAVSSVDLVTNPAAGGRVLRLVASDTVPHTLEGDGRMLQKMIEAIKASGNQALVTKLTGLGANPTEDQVLSLYTEALKGIGTAPASGQKTEAELAADRATKEAADKVAADAAAKAAGAVQAGQITEAQFMEVRKDGLMLFVENTINGTGLHEPVKEALRTRLTEAVNAAKTQAELPAKAVILSQVKEQVDLFAKLAEKNIVMPATGRPRAEVLKSRQDKVVEAIDDFFGIKREGKATKIIGDAKLVSFRNLYVDITGDRDVTGSLKEATRLTESMDSTTFDQILGDSITRRMVAEYQMGNQAAWRGIIADVVPVSDFRTQRRMRFGGYGNLTTVAQGAPYPSMTSPTDEEATYSPAKRGGTEQITIEMIANDDVGAIRRIPTKLARAASQTLYEFVLDFMRTNAAIYDAVALAAAGHGTNISTTALSATQVSALRLKMKNQTDMSNGKRIGLAARYLWVPNDLEELAFQITGADRAVPDASLAAQAAPAAPNFIRAQGIRPVVVDYWTDTNDYWVTADIGQTPMIEMGFWGGEDPSLFVQDLPNVGSLFSNDAITYKMRHVYGGAVLDFRGFAGGIVP
jgi:hypothetical protein